MVYRTEPFSIILNDPKPKFQGHALTLNISEMAKDTVIVTMEGNRKPYPSFQMVSFSITISDL